MLEFKNELIRDILVWIPSHGHASVELQLRTYLQYLCTDTWLCLEDLLETMDYGDELQERGSLGNPW